MDPIQDFSASVSAHSAPRAAMMNEISPTSIASSAQPTPEAPSSLPCARVNGSRSRRSVRVSWVVGPGSVIGPRSAAGQGLSRTLVLPASAGPAAVPGPQPLSCPVLRRRYSLGTGAPDCDDDRSEERRVGKECSCRWSKEQEKKKKGMYNDHMSIEKTVDKKRWKMK